MLTILSNNPLALPGGHIWEAAEETRDAKKSTIVFACQKCESILVLDCYFKQAPLGKTWWGAIERSDPHCLEPDRSKYQR
jgi:hypothetical protein